MSYILDDSKQIKNYIINGALDFWQRVAGNTSTVSSSAAIGGYTADRIFNTSNGSGVNVKNYSVTRSTNIPTVSQSGFQSVYSYLFTAVSTMSTFAVGDFVAPFEYRVEGFDYSKIATKTVSFGFWVNASVVGSYNFALRNGALNRSYVTTFTINSANTWEFKSITVTLDTAGTYASDNTLALFVDIGAIAGTASQTSTLGSWQAGNVYTSSSVNNYLTAGATLSITQFSLVEGGSIGPKGFTRAGASIQQELAVCQRYYEKSYSVNTVLGTATGISSSVRRFNTGNYFPGSSDVSYRTPKRIPATITIYNAQNGATGSFAEYNGGSTFNTNRAAGLNGANENGFSVSASSGDLNTTLGFTICFEWTADAEL